MISVYLGMGFLFICNVYLQYRVNSLEHRCGWLKNKLDATLEYVDKIHKATEYNTQTLKAHQDMHHNIGLWRESQERINKINQTTVQGILAYLSGKNNV